MFKLFGKKKDQQPDPQTQPAQEDPQVLQSQHPLASALAAQFGQEEFDILAVTGANSFGGEQCPGEEYRTVTLPITAWREDDGPVHQEDTCLVALADDTLLAYLRRRAPMDSIIQARVRQGLEDDRFLLVGMPTPMVDPELKAILEKQKQPVSLWVPDLGTFTLNRSVGWFQADVDWLGQSVQLVYDQGTEEEMKKAQEAALELMSAQEKWDKAIRTYASEQLPIQYAGSEEEMLQLPPEELEQRLEPESIQVWPEGSFEFWFHDADYQWEHALRVHGTLTGGLDRVNLEG